MPICWPVYGKGTVILIKVDRQASFFECIDLYSRNAMKSQRQDREKKDKYV